MDIAQYIDHTLLKPVAVEAEIRQLCKEAMQYKFYAVCVNGCYVKICNSELQDTEIKIAGVAGFPLGAMDTRAKIYEAETAVNDGADEIDMVMNIGFLRSGNYKDVENEIRQVRTAIGNRILKVIIETCYLTEEEKKTAAQILCNEGADFVKTSTGFGSGGATIEDVELIRSVINEKTKIKASGGIKDYETAIKFIKAGASRIGTSSGIQIVTRQGSSTSY
jgi:deoxyribose-phosphate aldolase